MMTNLLWSRRRSARMPGRRNDVERLFEALPTGRLFSWIERSLFFAPRLDVAETERGYVLVADLPGLRREDVDIRIEDETILTISGERRHGMREPWMHAYRERRHGTFMRSIQLPHGVDTSRIEAEFHDGVLEVHVPKVEPRRGRDVPIGSSSTRERANVDGTRSPSATS